MSKSEEKLYLVADETSAPYENWENHLLELKKMTNLI